jgi:predicted dehydrogenase
VNGSDLECTPEGKGAGRAVPFRLAIAGAGRIAREAHVPATLSTPLVRLVALVDPVRQRASDLARDYGISPAIATDVREVIAGVDGALIATPNDTHGDVALACLEAGVAVLVEKPLATSAAEGERIVRAGEERNVVVAVGYPTRFYDNVRLMRELLDEGYFGPVLRFLFQFGTRGGWSPVSGYTLDRAAAGGGVLVVSGAHFLDRLLYWFGPPDEVSLEEDALDGPEANATATFRYTSAAPPFSGVARFSKTVDLPPGFAMEAGAGTVTVREGPDAEIRFRPRRSPGVESAVRRRDPAPKLTQLLAVRAQLEDFIRAARGRGAPSVPGRDGLASLRLLEALYANRRPMRREWYGPRREVESSLWR